MKRKLMFLFMSFILTFVFAVNVKAAYTCTSWVNGSITVRESASGYTSTEPAAPAQTWNRIVRGPMGSSECAGEGLNVQQCYAVTTATRTCTEQASTTITCTNPTYNGQSQTIATCSGGSITNSSGTRTNAGTYTVTCQGGQLVSKECSIAKATGSISNFASFSMTKGSSRALSATGTGTITYSTVGGSSVIVDGGGVTAVATGSTTVRATSAATTNYTQVTKDITITVTEPAACGAGQGIGTGSSSSSACGNCLAGYYSPANDNVCHACSGIKQYSSAGATSCDTCESGKMANSGHTACITVSSPCCVTNPSGGTKTTINDLSGCQQAVAANQPVENGACPTTPTTGVCCCTSDKSTCSWMNACTSSQPTAISGATQSNCKDNEVEPTSTCPTGKYENESGQCVDCNTPGSYKSGKKCFVCPDGYKADDAHAYCYIKVSAGGYLVTPGGPAINSCAPGTYSTGKDVKLGEAYTCTSCGAGKTGPIGAKSASECYEKADESQCTVSASTSEVRVSYTDHFNVHVSVSGKGCNGQTLTLSPTRGTLPASNHGTYNVNDGSAFNFTVTVTTQSSCTSTTSLTATLSNGKSSTATVNTIRPWHMTQSNVCVKTSVLAGAPYNGVNSRNAAEMKPQDVYYIVKDNAGCGSDYRRVDIWRRGCGGDSFTNPACYLDKTSGEYVWGEHDNDTTRYTKITTITTEAACKKPEEETPYCYKKVSDGTYHWGKYQGNEEYTLVDTSITEDKCKDPETEEEPACYINGNTGEYVWGKYDGITLYSLVASITSEDKCVNPTGKCYKHKTTGEYVWGVYDEDVYEPISSITSKDKCKVACFKCENDEYKWGGYDEYGSCELVPNVTTADSCKPVPVTGATVSKIIYALSLFLIMAGSGIVVYQLTKTKKQMN